MDSDDFYNLIAIIVTKPNDNRIHRLLDRLERVDLTIGFSLSGEIRTNLLTLLFSGIKLRENVIETRKSNDLSRLFILEIIEFLINKFNLDMITIINSFTTFPIDKNIFQNVIEKCSFHDCIEFVGLKFKFFMEMRVNPFLHDGVIFSYIMHDQEMPDKARYYNYCMAMNPTVTLAKTSEMFFLFLTIDKREFHEYNDVLNILSTVNYELTGNSLLREYLKYEFDDIKIITRILLTRFKKYSKIHSIREQDLETVKEKDNLKYITRVLESLKKISQKWRDITNKRLHRRNMRETFITIKCLPKIGIEYRMTEETTSVGKK